MKSNQNNQALKHAYAGIIEREGVYCIAVEHDEAFLISSHKIRGTSEQERIAAILRAINELAHRLPGKIVAATINSIMTQTNVEEFASRLWLEQDIVPVIAKKSDESIDDESTDIDINDNGQTEVAARAGASNAKTQFTEEGVLKISISSRSEVEVPWLVRLSDYKDVADKNATEKNEFTLLLDLAKQWKQEKLSMIFINATPQGGGVALMRHGLIRLCRLLGVNVRWYVMKPNAQIFTITKKKFHNVLQGVPSATGELTDDDKRVYEEWINENANILRPAIKQANVIVIDDPQPAGLIPQIKKHNPDAKIIYRSHIHLASQMINQEGTIQHRVWSFLWQYINLADMFVSHPIQDFIPAQVDQAKTILMPATTDPLDGLNKNLSNEQIHYYMNMFNEILAKSGQTSLDPARPYIIQVARFDPAKGISDVLESYAILRARVAQEQHKQTPQLVIVGHGSIDDPEGNEIYQKTMRQAHEGACAPYVADIKIAQLPASDQLLNALMRGAYMALQLSHHEGLEVKVTEAIAKGKPIVIYNVGGMPLQVKNTVTGFVVEKGDVQAVAEHMYQLIIDEKLYTDMCNRAAAEVSPDFFTVSNAQLWLFLGREMVLNKTFKPKGELGKILVHT